MAEGDTESRAEMPEQPWRMMNGNRQELGIACQTVTATKDMARPRTDKLMEEVLRRENLFKALKRVQKNKGAPGVDGMTVDELQDAGYPHGSRTIYRTGYLANPHTDL